MSKQPPVIAVHGGAWAIPSQFWHQSLEGVKNAALTGFQVLKANGSALDAVEAAVMCLENNPVFNAGTGSSLTLDEEVELDALIMDGKHLKAGSVGAIRNIANPIRVARLVMEKTPHVLLVGDGANKFASMQGIETVSLDDLVTSGAKEQIANIKKFNTPLDALFTDSKRNACGHDTVGCVALDSAGHVACGTSTGGIPGKLPGRVGDCPIIGAGGMADDHIGAVSSTGHGEAIMKSCLAKSILVGISNGDNVGDAIKSALDCMKLRLTSWGGAICVSSKGNVAAEFSTDRMSWAFVKDGQLHYGLHPNQHEVTDIPTS